VNGQTLQFGGSVTNNGLIQASNGSTVQFAYESLTNLDLSPGVLALTGGTYEVDAGSTIYMAASVFTGDTASIAKNAANIVLNGVNSTFTTLASLSTNSGSFTLKSGAAFTTAGALTNSGTVFIGAATGGNPASALTVSGNFDQTAGFTENDGTLAVGGGITLSGGTIKNTGQIGPVTILSISNGGTLDLTNTHLIINYGSNPDPITSIAAWIASGYAGGTWTGTGITSSAAAANSSSYGLGYADSADPGNPAGLGSGTIEIKYTLLGDANLDGVVNAIDFGILAANFNKGVTGWDKGDFNYDNVVSAIDFGELATNFNKGASQSADAELIAFAQANGLMADVPEPATATVVSIGLVGLLSCRRRRQFHPAASAGRRVSVN
jgi:hypothetical protein